jgi:hypothetical protein
MQFLLSADNLKCQQLPQLVAPAPFATNLSFLVAHFLLLNGLGIDRLVRSYLLVGNQAVPFYTPL